MNTSNLIQTGLDATIKLVLFDTNGQSDECILDQSKLLINSKWDLMDYNNLIFTPNSIKLFRAFLSNQLDLLYKLRISHDNQGLKLDWHLKKIKMIDLNQNREYEFYCNRWLSQTKDDHMICRELPANGPDIIKEAPSKHFAIIHIYFIILFFIFSIILFIYF